MTIELFLLMLSIPIGAMLTLGPAWLVDAWSNADLAAPRCLPRARAAAPLREAYLHHPSAALELASDRGTAYLGAIATRWSSGELDPMASLLAGRLRDRFETAMLAAIEAVRDWLSATARPVGSARPHAPGRLPGHLGDPRTELERERIHEELGSLIAALPTFPHHVDLGPRCHYRVGELQWICLRLRSLAARVDRHERIALLPPTSPYR